MTKPIRPPSPLFSCVELKNTHKSYLTLRLSELQATYPNTSHATLSAFLNNVNQTLLDLEEFALAEHHHLTSFSSLVEKEPEPQPEPQPESQSQSHEDVEDEEEEGSSSLSSSWWSSSSFSSSESESEPEFEEEEKNMPFPEILRKAKFLSTHRQGDTSRLQKI